MSPSSLAGRKLLHIIASVDPSQGGPVEALNQLSRVYQANGVDLEVATLDQPDAPFLKTLPFKVHALGRPHATERWSTTRAPWVRYRFSAKYPRWLEQNLGRYDMAVVQGVWTYHSLGAAGPLKRAGRPYLAFTHGALDPWFRKSKPLKHWIKQLFWWAGDGRLLRGARWVLFTTESERVLSHNAFLDYRLRERVVRYGIADPPAYSDAQKQAFEAAAPEIKGKRYLLFLSRIHPKKGCDLLVQAFASVAAADPELHLVIAGPDETGWSATLKEAARGAGVADRIHWPGMLKGDAKWGAFWGCEAFVLPSHQENFGIVVAEALACGKPTLISDQVNIWREIDAAGAGIVRPDTLQGATDMLDAWVRSSPEQKKAQAIAARACFVKCFDIKQTSTDILGLIREVLDNDGS